MTSRTLTVALMLESDGPGGAEVVVREMARELRRKGHRVLPIGPEKGQGWLGEQLRADGFETHTFQLRGMLDWRYARRLAAWMREQGVDVMHGHEFDGALYGTAAARLSGRASVVTMHGNQGMTAAWRRRLILRWTFRACDAVVAVSDQTKQQLDADLRLRPGVVSVIHNGMPLRTGDAAPVRRELGVREGELLLLCVGSLVPRKGHITLLRALARLESQGLRVPWRLAIVGGGGGPERPAIEAFIAEHGMADRVHVLTYRNDIPDLQAAADVFLMPSLWEGFPLAILEAMLAGTPVVASDVCGIPEAIVAGEHGLLVPPGDVDALAAALRSMLTDDVLREGLAAAASARAHREFTVQSMVDAYEQLYWRYLP